MCEATKKAALIDVVRGFDPANAATDMASARKVLDLAPAAELCDGLPVETRVFVGRDHATGRVAVCDWQRRLCGVSSDRGTLQTQV